MFYLGLLLPVCFVPGYIGAIIPTQWVVLSMILPLGLWRSGVFIPATWAGLAILAWSAISITWAPNAYDAGFGLWLACIWALAFWFGTTINDFRPLWRGLAVGMTINSAVVISQALGYRPVLGEGNAGLMFNSTLLGCSAVLVIIALVSQRQWHYIPGILPAFFLAHSRGAFLVLALTLLTRWLRVRYILCAMALAAVILVLTLNDFTSDSDKIRLTIWGSTIRSLNLWGHGIGSFSTYLIYSDRMLYPERVHNDYLQLWFELGPMALAVYFAYFMVLRQRTSDHWPIFFAFTLFGLFYFPLWAPIPAFMACVVAGAMLRDRYLDWFARVHGRYVGLPGRPLRNPIFPRLGRKTVPAASTD